MPNRFHYPFIIWSESSFHVPSIQGEACDISYRKENTYIAIKVSYFIGWLTDFSTHFLRGGGIKKIFVSITDFFVVRYLSEERMK
jgi:hypothetical protein